jgi:lipopolysaccharide export system ATP-binding protein
MGMIHTRQSFLDYMSGLGPHDLSVAVAACELFRRADENGRTERGIWIASVLDRYEEAQLRSGAEGSLLSATAGFGRYLEDRVIPRLEADGVARRNEPNESWEFLAFTEPLWSALKAEKAAVQADLEQVVRFLQEGRDVTFRAGAQAPGTNGSRLEARGLVKVYRKRKVVNEVDLSVRQGEIVGLLGPNGAGKTTTFYMMVGLIPPNDGEVYLDDVELTETPMYRRARMGVGYLAQEPSIFRKLTVEENVLAILETLGISKKDRAERLEQLLGELSIAHLRKSKAYSLSGGERRRLEITRALVQRPKFMLLDEPFAGIDPIAVNDIQQIVAGLKHRGIGVIISDHNVEQTLEIVDRAYIMYEGRIRVSGTVPELVWNDEVAAIYLGPVLTQRMRQRFASPN